MSVEKRIAVVYNTYVKPHIRKNAITVESYRNGTLYLNINKKVKDRTFLASIVDIFTRLVPEVETVKRSDYTDVLPPQKLEEPNIEITVEANGDWE